MKETRGKETGAKTPGAKAPGTPNRPKTGGKVIC